MTRAMPVSTVPVALELLILACVTLSSTAITEQELSGELSLANAALVEAVADTEMGRDLGTYLVLNKASVSQSVASGPATLAEYCAGDTEQEHKMKLKKGKRVMANWENYGTFYPGRISKKNSDGTVDIHYDDGFEEKGVTAKHVKPVEEEKDEAQENDSQGSKPKQRNDPACKMLDFLDKLKGKLADIDPMISQWLAAQRARLASGKKPTAPPVIPDEGAVVVPPPAAAPPGSPSSAEPSEELEGLKRQIADRDAEIAKLKKQKDDNREVLQRHSGAAPMPAPPSGVQTVDDLIARYKAQLTERDAEIQALRKDIQTQEQELARLGATQMSLKDIDEAVRDLEVDAEEARKKRDLLEKDGELDPDLRAVLDEILEDLQKMRKKVDNLIAHDAKAKARAEEAERKAELAAEAARKQAEKVGEDPDEAAAQAVKRSKEEAKETAREDELETLKAAQEVKKDLDAAEKAATHLDTGLHPHGSKWWRYRYEYSYIESLLMIFISCLMLFWSRIMHHLKHYVKVWALPSDEEPKSQIEEMDEDVHGTFYSLWLKLFTEQMMVCILVFLTIWVLAKMHVFDVFPMLIKATPDMRVPQTGEEYQLLTFDICTIFFFAIMFYFCLMLTVAHDTRDLTRALEKREQGSQFYHLSQSPTSSRTTASQAVMGTLKRSNSGFNKTEAHFVCAMEEEMMTREEPEMKEICTLLNNDIQAFPLWKYLILNVRITTAGLLEFSWTMWLPVVASFLAFMLLHRFAHMGYLRIMACFGVFTLSLVASIAWIAKRTSAMLQAEDYKPNESGKHHSIHERMNTESMVLCAFQFALFFVCYGVARMMCQPWMWEMHFWTVLCLTIVAGVHVVLFITLVSPAIPSFCAVMALPPYVDSDNLAVMLHVAKGVAVTSMGS
jgi:hypothetical protein